MRLERLKFSKPAVLSFNEFVLMHLVFHDHPQKWDPMLLKTFTRDSRQTVRFLLCNELRHKIA